MPEKIGYRPPEEKDHLVTLLRGGEKWNGVTKKAGLVFGVLTAPFNPIVSAGFFVGSIYDNETQRFSNQWADARTQKLRRLRGENVPARATSYTSTEESRQVESKVAKQLQQREIVNVRALEQGRT